MARFWGIALMLCSSVQALDLNQCRLLKRRDYKQQKLSRSGSEIVVGVDIQNVDFSSELFAFTIDLDKQLIATANTANIQSDDKLFVLEPYSRATVHTIHFDFINEKAKCVRLQTAYACPKFPTINLKSALSNSAQLTESGLIRAPRISSGCFDVNQGIEVNNDFTCRNCIRVMANFKMNNFGFFGLKNGDYMEVTFTSPVEFHSAGYPITGVEYIEGNTVRIMIDPAVKWDNKRVVWEAELRYSGDTVPSVVSSRACAASHPSTTAPAVPTTSTTTIETTTDVSATTPAPSTDCQSLGASAASIGGEWACRSCMRVLVDFHTDDALTEQMTVQISFNSDVEIFEYWYPVASVSNVGSNTVEFTFESDKDWSQGHVQFEVQLKHPDSVDSIEITDVNMCSTSATATSSADTTTPITTTSTTTASTAVETTQTTTTMTAPDAGDCVDISLGSSSITNDFPCDDTNCIEISINAPLGDLSSIGGVGNMKMELWFTGAVSSYSEADWWPVASSQPASASNGMEFLFVSDPQWQNDQMIFTNQVKYDGDSAPSMVAARFCPISDPTTQAASTSAPDTTTAPAETTQPATTMTPPNAGDCIDVSLGSSSVTNNYPCGNNQESNCLEFTVDVEMGDLSLIGGENNMLAEVWFTAPVSADSQGDWFPIESSQTASSSNGMQFTFADNAVWENGNMQWNNRIQYDGDTVPVLTNVRLCPAGIITTTAEVIITTATPLTMPTDSGDCIDIPDGAAVQSSWACRSCLQFLVDFTYDLSTLGGVENVYLELWFDTDVDEQSTWHPVAGTESASAANGMKFNFEPNVFPQGRVQFDGQLKHTLNGDEIPTLIGTRLCPISPVTTTAEVVTTPAETTPAPTTSVPLTMPTEGGDCIDIANGASIENSWACRSCLQFLVNFNHDLTTIGGVQNAYLELWFDTDVEVHSTWNPVAGTEPASASNGMKFTFESDAFQQGVVQFDGQLKHNLENQPSVVGVRLCPINPDWSTTTSEVITTTVAPTTTPEPLTMIPLDGGCWHLPPQVADINHSWGNCRSCLEFEIEFALTDAQFASVGGQSNMFINLGFTKNVQMHDYWYPVSNAENVADNVIKFNFQPDQWHTWADNVVTWSSQLKFDGDNEPEIAGIHICPVDPDWAVTTTPVSTTTPETTTTPTTTPPTTEAPLTVPDNTDCVDIENGATIEQSWACRSCLEFKVDFTMTDAQIATVITPENMYLELWFSTEVDVFSTWFPVGSTAPASSSHGIQLYFEESNTWQQNKVAFTGQLRYTQAGWPTVIGVRMCPVDPNLTTASPTTTPVETTTAATEPASTTPVTTTSSEPITTTEAITMTMPVDENGCLEYPNGAVVNNEWACRNCLQLFVDLTVSQADMSVIGSLDNMYVEVWFDSVEVEPMGEPGGWYPVESAETASSSNGIKYSFKNSHNWPATGVVQFDNQLKFTGSNPSVAGVRVCPVDPVTTSTVAPETTTAQPTTTVQTTTTVVTTMAVPDIGDCLDVGSSSVTIENTWACRSCLQLHIDFTLTDANFASIGGVENMALELWFTDSVEYFTKWDPVDSIEQASQDNGLVYTFKENRDWPNGLVEFDSQIRFNSGEAPVVSAARVCPIGVVTTASPSETTTAEQVSTTAEIETSTQSAVTTTEAPVVETTVAETTTAAETTTPPPDWETICAQPEESLADNLNFDKGGWGVSRIMFTGQGSALIRVNVAGKTATAPYSGSAFFARKYCGNDFLSKFENGTIQFDILDEVISYNSQYGFYKDDSKNSAYVIQWGQMATAGNLGNQNRDQLYIQLTGLDSVVWGNKNMQECLADNLVIASMDHTTDDKTPCLAWQRTVGN